MIFNILDNTTEFYMTKYIIGEIFSSGRATLYKNPSDQTVNNPLNIEANSFFEQTQIFVPVHTYLELCTLQIGK